MLSQLLFVWLELNERRRYLRFRTSENKRREPFCWIIRYWFLSCTYYMQGWSSPSGWRSYNISFSIMHKFIGRGSRQIWQSNCAVAVKANCWTLLQDSVCPILQVVTPISSCKLIEETCERKFALHFDYCTTASLDFVFLDEATFSSIIRVGACFIIANLL